MPSDRETPITLRHVHIMDETRDAVRIATRDGTERWLPKTDIFSIDRSAHFFASKVTVSTFIAKQEGLV